MPVTKIEIQRFAEAMARQGGDLASFGKGWIDRFITRHPDIKMKPTREVEPVLKRFVKEEGIRDYLLRLKRHYGKADNQFNPSVQC